MNDEGRRTRSQSSQAKQLEDGATQANDKRTGDAKAEIDGEPERFEDATDDNSFIIRELAARGSTSEEISTRAQDKNQISENNVSTFRILRKLTKSALRAEHNKQKLENLVREGRLPKGLGVRRFPLNVPNPSLALQIRWDEAHTKLSKELTILMIEFWEERHHKVKKDIEELNLKLRTEASKAEQDISIAIERSQRIFDFVFEHIHMYTCTHCYIEHMYTLLHWTNPLTCKNHTPNTLQTHTQHPHRYTL